MIVLSACGTVAPAPIDCGEGGEYVVVEDVRYCVYSDDIVIIGGFHCPPALPHHFGGDPAVICSDHPPVPGPLPTPVCAVNPRACEEPRLDAGAPTDSGRPTDAGAPTDAAPPTDSGPPTDAAPPTDAGPPTDASPPTDSGAPTDSGPPTDAGPTDPGPPTDAGPTDSGPPTDAGPPTDSGPPGPPTDSGPPRSPIGGACLPASVPPGGFTSAEVHLETTSSDCESNVCIVYELDGDPSPGCSGADCADPAETDARVFCSCRCDAEPGQPTCTCPGGMRCQADVVTVGGPGIRGGYCVPDAL